MNGPSGLLSRYRIRHGQTIAGNVWSNTAVTITGRFRCVYDDGEEDWFRIDDTASGSSRAQVVFSSGNVAKHDGWIVGGTLTYRGAFLQRGQCFAEAVITDPVGLAEYTDVLCYGYLYFVGLELGTFVEPGPAGGHGNLRSISLGDPAANTQLTAQTVPAGAIQLLRSLNCPETAAGAATRDWVVSYTYGTNIIGQVQEVSGTATGVLDNLMAMIAGNSADLASLQQNYIALPMIYLPAGFTWAPVLNNIAALDNIGPSFASVEEWVMPN